MSDKCLGVTVAIRGRLYGVIGKWVFSVFVIPAGRMMMLPDARAAFLKHFALREAHARGAAVTGGPIISRANSGAGAATFR
jgi:hypothetical protein